MMDPSVVAPSRWAEDTLPGWTRIAPVPARAGDVPARPCTTRRYGLGARAPAACDSYGPSWILLTGRWMLPSRPTAADGRTRQRSEETVPLPSPSGPAGEDRRRFGARSTPERIVATRSSPVSPLSYPRRASRSTNAPLTHSFNSSRSPITDGSAGCPLDQTPTGTALRRLSRRRLSIPEFVCTTSVRCAGRVRSSTNTWLTRVSVHDGAICLTLVCYTVRLRSPAHERKQAEQRSARSLLVWSASARRSGDARIRQHRGSGSSTYATARTAPGAACASASTLYQSS